MEAIENKIANAGLVKFDLEKLYPKGERVNLDISKWLWQEMIIKEKHFKEHLENHDWSQYQNSYVYITCNSDAIVPNWSYMLLAKYLSHNCKGFFLGNKEEMELNLFSEAINLLDLTPFEDARVLVKGCSEAAVPPSAYVILSQKLIPIVKSLMFGEACSNVPIYKKKK
jgi:hypothetical protein